MSFAGKKYDDAHLHLKRATTQAIGDPHRLGRATELDARFWYSQHEFEKAKSEALRAANLYENIGATKDVEDCRAILSKIEAAIDKPAVSH